MACTNDIFGNKWEVPVNITEKQRTISSVAGGALLALGILDFSKSGFRRAIRMTLGTLLLLRGVSGYCPMTAAVKKSAEEAGDVLTQPAYQGE